MNWLEEVPWFFYVVLYMAGALAMGRRVGKRVWEMTKHRDDMDRQMATGFSTAFCDFVWPSVLVCWLIDYWLDKAFNPLSGNSEAIKCEIKKRS
jgi:hypothetical protein